MTYILSHDMVTNMIHQIGLKTVYRQLVRQMKLDYMHWHDFHHQSRISAESPNGVIELMPIHNQQHYAFKYVNGHPSNPSRQLPSVCAFGCLSDMDSGIPVLIADMTLLTAIRTAACAAMVYDCIRYPQDTIDIAIIGTGAQSEFQITAMHEMHPIGTCYYYDIDDHAMQKFSDNLSEYPFNLQAINGVADIPSACDVIITATSCLTPSALAIKQSNRRKIIIAIGGDAPNKQELNRTLIENSTVIVEYLAQTKREGEIKSANPKQIITLHELVQSKQTLSNDLIVFDSVGFAIEDYSTLVMCQGWFESLPPHEFFGVLDDPKNLFSQIIQGTP